MNRYRSVGTSTDRRGVLEGRSAPGDRHDERSGERFDRLEVSLRSVERVTAR